MAWKLECEFEWSNDPVQILMVVAIKTSENLVDRVDKGSLATVVV